MKLENVKQKYFEPDKNWWVIDLEADSLTPTQIWCVVVSNLQNNQTLRFYGPKAAESFNDWLEPGITFVGHNAISFDVPVLNRLWGCSIDLASVVDTLVLSYLGNPKRLGGHSLEAWGTRLGFSKIDFNDWSGFSAEMLKYCEGDVQLTVKLYRHLVSEMKDRFSETSAYIEHQTRRIIDQQQSNGIWFDMEAATKLRDQLDQRKAELEQTIHEVFPPKLVVKGTYNYRLKADGTPYSSYLRHTEEYPRLQFNRSRSKYRVWDYQEFNIGSPAQRVERLLDLGWKPRTFTPKGSPKVDEDSLVEFADKSGNTAVAAIAEWLVCSGRSNMLKNWMGYVDESDSRLRGRVFSCGAASRRMRHTSPNTANIPGIDAPYGAECRSFWGVVPGSGRRLVGADASGLEGRVLVHYLDNADAAPFFLEGDPHTANAEAVGYDRRPTKNLFYAFMYGASDKKLGSMVGKGPAEGARIRTALMQNVPGLEELVTSLQREYNENNGWLKSIDGGRVLCPSPHAALNYKNQSAGAIFMKVASIILEESLKGYDALKVLDVHDEWQYDVAEHQAHQVGALMVDAMEKAGVELGFRIAMTGEYKIGHNWSTTH